jgi:hypothetical protein
MMATVRWTQAAPGALRPEDAWWQSLTDAGWLAAQSGRIVVHVARSARSTLVVETARSLIAHLRRTDRRRDRRDRSGRQRDRMARRRLDRSRVAERLRIDAVCLRTARWCRRSGSTTSSSSR